MRTMNQNQTVKAAKAVETVSGKVDRIISDKGTWCLFVCLTGRQNLNVSYAGQCPKLGMTVVCKGEHTEHPRFGRQFKAFEVVCSMPASVNGAIEVLQNVEGIGKVKARRIAEKLGEDTLNIIASNPKALSEGFTGISETLSARVAEYISATKNNADLDATLAAIGVGSKTRQNAVDTYGKAQIQEWILTNPYLLIQVPRITFKMVDGWVLKTGRLAVDSIERGAAIVAEALKIHGQWGHTVGTVKDIFAIAKNPKALCIASEYPENKVQAAIDFAVDQKLVACVENEQLALFKIAEAESYCASKLAAWNAAPCELGSVRNLGGMFDQLNEQQQQAVQNAITNRVSVITGGPGTGKTFVSRAVLTAMKPASCYIVAPTGKAAKRAAVVTGMAASTIHRFVGKLATGKMECPQVILIDECSMVSVEVFHMLLKVLNSETRIVIVGDVDQLPSISCGAVLQDVIESGTIPVTRLTQVMRQAEGSEIVNNARKINEGNNDLAEGTDFMIFANDNEDRIRAALLGFITKRLPEMGYEYLRDCQVLVGQKRGTIGSNGLNEAIRGIFNPASPDKAEMRGYTADDSGAMIPGCRFRTGDRVIVTENLYEIGVVNGDMGVIKDIKIDPKDAEKNCVTVTIDGEQTFDVPFVNGDIDALQQAWAITVHKSQGSEYPVSIVVTHSKMPFTCQRALLYTGVTRGKQMVACFCDRKGINDAVARETRPRYTRLGRLLRVSTG